jgi:hypothetical protein
VVSAVASCGSSGASPGTSTTRAAKAGPVAPRTSITQESTYLEDVAAADPTLATYAQSGTTADKALLTDGVAFCAFLGQGKGIDDALTELTTGAQSIQSTTHLPLGVTTFNTISGVALVVLCPDELHFLPAADQARIRQLGQALAGGSG